MSVLKNLNSIALHVSFPNSYEKTFMLSVVVELLKVDPLNQVAT